MNDNNDLEKFIVDDTQYITRVTPKFSKRKPYIPFNPKVLTAFIPGIIQEVYVSKGQTVRRGDPLFILEAMKMKNAVVSQIDGYIKTLNVEAGKMVAKGELLLEYE